MELTPEEKHRIYEEEKARIEAAEKAARPSPLTIHSLPDGIAMTDHEQVRLDAEARVKSNGQIKALTVLGACAVVMLVVAGIYSNVTGSPPAAPAAQAAATAAPTPYVDHLKAAMAFAAKKQFSSAVDELDAAPDNDPKHATIVEKRVEYSQAIAEQERVQQALDLEAFIKTAKASGLRLKQVIKAPGNYTGDAVAWKGRIMQITEDAGNTVAQVSYYENGESTGDNFIVNLDGTSDALQDDWVAVYGTFDEMKDYTSTANYQLSSPLLKGRAIRKIAPLRSY